MLQIKASSIVFVSYCIAEILLTGIAIMLTMLLCVSEIFSVFLAGIVTGFKRLTEKASLSAMSW